MSNSATISRENTTHEQSAPVSETTKEFLREANANKLLQVHTACDSCSARSTNVVFAEGTTDVAFSFCGHHTRKHAVALQSSGYSIFPEDYSFVKPEES